MQIQLLKHFVGANLRIQSKICIFLEGNLREDDFRQCMNLGSHARVQERSNSNITVVFCVRCSMITPLEMCAPEFSDLH
jgi:hypothetical protein